MAISQQEARDLIEQGQRYSRHAARFPMSWLGYTMICGSGILYLLGVSTSGRNLPIIFWIIFGAWTTAGLILSIFLGALSRCVPTGFGTRWTVMMLLWALMWIMTVLGAATFHYGYVLILGLIYVLLAVGGPLWEFAAMRGRK